MLNPNTTFMWTRVAWQLQIQRVVFWPVPRVFEDEDLFMGSEITLLSCSPTARKSICPQLIMSRCGVWKCHWTDGAGSFSGPVGIIHLHWQDGTLPLELRQKCTWRQCVRSSIKLDGTLGAYSTICTSLMVLYEMSRAIKTYHIACVDSFGKLLSSHLRFHKSCTLEGWKRYVSANRCLKIRLLLQLL